MIETFTGTPTEQGWYVARLESQHPWEVVEVTDGLNGLVAYQAGSDVDLPLMQFTFCARIRLDTLPLF